MCGRFTATFEFSDIRVRWNLDRDLRKYKPRFNVAPEQISPTIPVIVRHGQERVQANALGFDSALGRRSFHRQSYDKRESENTNRVAFLQVSRNGGRYIIPADGFYEWRKEGRRKVPCRFSQKQRAFPLQLPSSSEVSLECSCPQGLLA